MDENPDVKAAEVQQPTESSPVEQTTEEAKVPEAVVATSTEEAKAETGESNKGANQRIRELVKDKKLVEEEVKSLKDRLAEVTATQSPLPQQQQFTPSVQPGAEITQEQYQADVMRMADARVELKIQQNNAVTRINNEATEAIRKYPQLDPKSDQFDKDLSDTVTEAVDSHVRVNPYSASVIKFVDKLMKPYQKAVTKEVANVTEKITKQVSETALRPTSIRKSEKSAKDKTIKELEEELGIVY